MNSPFSCKNLKKEKLFFQLFTPVKARERRKKEMNYLHVIHGILFVSLTRNVLLFLIGEEKKKNFFFQTSPYRIIENMSAEREREKEILVFLLLINIGISSEFARLP